MSNTKKWRLQIGAATVAALTMTSGCAAVSGGPAQSADRESDELTYWSSWPEGTPQNLLEQEIVSDFEAETGVKVDYKPVGTDLTADLNKAVSTDSPMPDVFFTTSGNIEVLRDSGALQSPTAALEATSPGQESPLQDTITDIYLEASSDDEGVGLVPAVVNGSGIWYDGSAHPELAEAPQTYDALLDLAADYQADGLVPFAQEGAQSRYNLFWLFMLLMRHGGPGTMAGLSQSVDAWDAPEVRAAVDDVVRLVDGDFFQPGFEGSVYPNAQNAWRQGEMVMELNGSWLASETNAVAPDGSEPGVFAFPAVEGAAHNDAQYMMTMGYAVSGTTKKTDVAAEFIAFALQEKYQERVASEVGTIPVLDGVKAPGELRTLQKQLIDAKEYAKTWDNLPSVAPKFFTDVLPPLDDRLIKGELTADQFIAEGKAQTEAYLSGAK